MSELPLGRLVIDEHPLMYVSERGPRFSRGDLGPSGEGASVVSRAGTTDGWNSMITGITATLAGSGRIGVCRAEGVDLARLISWLRQRPSRAAGGND
jgi:hypothetical protein